LQGYFDRKNLPETLIKSAFSNLVATKQIRPAKPGEQTILPNVPWAWKQGADLSDIKDQVGIQNTLDLMRNRNKPPRFTYGNATTALMSSPYGFEALDKPAEETAMKMKALVDAVNKISGAEAGVQQTEDPVLVAIKKAKVQGMTDDQIKENLQELGYEPSDYGY
jgi:hypothetical protein